MVPVRYKWSYQTTSKVYYRENILHSTTGKRPVSIGTNAVNKSITADFPTVKNVAFFDDYTLFGSQEDVIETMEALGRRLETIGLVLNKQKCQIQGHQHPKLEQREMGKFHGVIFGSLRGRNLHPGGIHWHARIPD